MTGIGSLGDGHPSHSSQLRTRIWTCDKSFEKMRGAIGAKKGLFQQEVANRMGVDRAYISGLELGQRNPTIITLWHAAQALEVEVHLLLKEENP
jgi:DNA-binding XRE family transcriptional regulator